MFVFFLLIGTSFYVLDPSPLLVMRIANFFCFVACLFTLLMVSISSVIVGAFYIFFVEIIPYLKIF